MRYNLISIVHLATFIMYAVIVDVLSNDNPSLLFLMVVLIVYNNWIERNKVYEN